VGACNMGRWMGTLAAKLTRASDQRSLRRKPLRPAGSPVLSAESCALPHCAPTPCLQEVKRSALHVVTAGLVGCNSAAAARDAKTVAEHRQALEHLFASYASFGVTRDLGSAPELDSFRCAKLVREAGLLGGRLRMQDLDVLFAAAARKGGSSRRWGLLAGWQEAVLAKAVSFCTWWRLQCSVPCLWAAGCLSAHKQMWRGSAGGGTACCDQVLVQDSHKEEPVHWQCPFSSPQKSSCPLMPVYSVVPPHILQAAFCRILEAAGPGC
jgi:hypothetical protein